MAKEIFKVYNEVFDQRTLRVLEKLRKEYYEELEYCISTGKEANVFLASSKNGFVAVKIFRTYTSSFDKMSPYIIGDKRFSRISKKKHEIINLWARKEFRNLSKAFEERINVPKPIACVKNVLVMEFIGEDGKASPLLKDAQIKDFQKCHDAIIELMVKLLKAGLVHADLSEFNILYYKHKPIMIDMGQSVLKSHPNAKEFLKKDFFNIKKFFERKCKTISFEEFLDKAK